LARLEQRLNPQTPLDGEHQIAEYWQKLRPLAAPELYTPKLARVWWQIGCSTIGAPYVLKGMMRTLSSFGPSYASDNIQVAQVLDGFLADKCAGARLLSDEARASLETLRDNAAKSITNPSTQLPDPH
jgi:hypothetical protein